MEAVLTSLVLITALAGTMAAQPPLEIHASLSGYNLLWPTSRCCAFQLHLAPDGTLTVELTIGDGVERQESVVSDDILASLRDTIDAADFLSLPSEFGIGVPDGDVHRMSITLGDHQHEAVLLDWPQNEAARRRWPQDDLDFTLRAHAVWSAIRALVTDPRATVH